MGIGVASPDEEDNSEPTDLETRSTIAKPLQGSQNVPNDSGIEKSPRGYGSASVLEALEFRRAQLEVPPACAFPATGPGESRDMALQGWCSGLTRRLPTTSGRGIRDRQVTSLGFSKLPGLGSS